MDDVHQARIAKGVRRWGITFGKGITRDGCNKTFGTVGTDAKMFSFLFFSGSKPFLSAHSCHCRAVGYRIVG